MNSAICTVRNFLTVSHKKIYFILRITLGIVFIWASWNKILNPEGFARIIQNYSILPPVLIIPAALILPWIEAVCGLFLITGYLIKGSALIVDLLMIIFIFAFIINLYREIDITCGCFSLSLQATQRTYFYILRDLLILCTGLWILFSD